MLCTSRNGTSENLYRYSMVLPRCTACSAVLFTLINGRARPRASANFATMARLRSSPSISEAPVPRA